MKRVMGSILLAACVAGSVFAQQLSTTPAPQTAKWWQPRFEQKQALAKQGGWELVFIGDSITHGWENGGKAVWQEHFGAYKALNLGYSADRTEHVLWRLDNGELEGYQPKLFVIMIGTNNNGHRKPQQESTADTVAGIQAILGRLEKKDPQSKVLLLAIFPRGATPQDALRVRNEAVNAEIQKLADSKRVFWLNINDKFLQPDGTLSKEIMPDLLHPNAKGYEIWARAILPAVKQHLGK